MKGYDDGMEPAVNPYESPALVEEPELPLYEVAQRARVWRRLVVPATAFFVLGGGQAAAILWSGGMFIGSAAFGNPWNDSEQVTQLVFGAGLLAIDVLIAYAGYRLLQLRSSDLGFAAALCCSVPFLSPLFVAGIPFGLWMLILLLMPSTCAVLDEEERRLRSMRDA